MNDILCADKFKEANDALTTASDELQELRRKTREREAYIRQLQVKLAFNYFLITFLITFYCLL